MSAKESSADPTQAARGLPAREGRRLPLHRRFVPAGRPVAGARRRPTGLAGMLALLLLIEGWLGRHWETFTDPVAFSWRWTTEAAGRATGDGVLCLGDSLAKHGLIPAVMGEGGGLPATNLAAAAAPAPLTYFALRRALDAGAAPRAIVLEYKPSVLAGGPKIRARCWPESLSVAEMADLARTARSTSLAAELAAGALLPSFRGRHDIRENLLAALRGETSRLRAINALCRRNWTVNGGANVATRQPGGAGEVTEEAHRNLLSDRFAVHRVNATYVDRALKLAADRGIPAYLLLPPFAPELLARRAATGAEARFTAFARSLQRRFPGLTVLDARGSGYPAAVFVDASHLDRHGAVTLSVDVAAAVAGDLNATGGARPPGRWVELPAFAPHPDPVPLEDVEQSRERLGIAWTP